MTAKGGRRQVLTELWARVDGGLGGVVTRQVLQVLLSGSRRHRDKLVRSVGRIFRIDNLGEDELGEGGVLGEQGRGRDGRAEHGDVLWSRHGDTENARTIRGFVVCRVIIQEDYEGNLDEIC